MMRKIFVLLIIAMVQSMTAFAAGEYTEVPPTNLAVNITLQSGTTCPSSLTREIDFENYQGYQITVSINFVEGTNCVYTGNVAPASLPALQSLGSLNNRSYWDKMYLSNNGGSTVLQISSFEVTVEYDTDGDAVIEISQKISGLTASGTLDAPYGELELSNWKFRACYACHYLKSKNILPNDCTSRSQINQCVTDLNNNFDRWTREFIYDLGKSGSDDSDDNGTNPKYGQDGSLCSDTVSWYYARYAYTASDPDDYSFYHDNFKDVSDWGSVRKIFSDTDPQTLYCFEGVNKQWKKCEGIVPWDGNVCTDWGTETTVPTAGDVAVWSWMQAKKDDAGNIITDPSGNPIMEPSGHTMMVLGWQDGTKELNVIEGPVPVKFRDPINVQTKTNNGNLICIGRIPDNE